MSLVVFAATMALTGAALTYICMPTFQLPHRAATQTDTRQSVEGILYAARAMHDRRHTDFASNRPPCRCRFPDGPRSAIEPQCLNSTEISQHTEG